MHQDALSNAHSMATTRARKAMRMGTNQLVFLLTEVAIRQDPWCSKPQ
jgi:hypothetical protein